MFPARLVPEIQNNSSFNTFQQRVFCVIYTGNGLGLTSQCILYSRPEKKEGERYHSIQWNNSDKQIWDHDMLGVFRPKYAVITEVYFESK